MGCWYSRMIERDEKVSRCKARMRYMKQVVKSRHGFAAAHVMYLRSLRNIGAALLQFATAENSLHHHPPGHHLLTPPASPPPPPPPPPRPNPRRPNPPMSPTSWTTTTTSTATSSAVHPPPPPPPQAGASAWDFWDPFMPAAGRSVDEEEWEEEEEETTSVSETAATTTAGTQSVAAPPSVVTATSAEGSSDLAVVVSGKGKDLVEIIQELDDYFLQAANAGGPLSALLEVPTSNLNSQTYTGKDFGNMKSLNPLMWTWGSSSAKWNTYAKFSEDPIGNKIGGNSNFNHCSTVERLYTWEKKLYQEVKNAEYLKLEHEKKAVILRKLEMNNADYIKTEKAKKEAEKLESQILVASQAIETISTEIVKLRESILYPQLLELVNGLTNMWRSMYEFHQVQTHIVQQLKYLNSIPSTEPTSEIHRQSTLQLELEAQQWHISFCNLMKSHRDYVQSLTGWLCLSLFQLTSNPFQKPTGNSSSAIYTLCEEWQHAINNAPDKVASEGIKSFLSMIHTIVMQQSDEQKQKKRSEAAFKELEKKAAELRSLENKHGAYSALESSKNPVREKRAKVDLLRAKAQDEQAKHEKAVGVTRAMTLNNLQMGLPHIFQALTGFANVSKQAFESMHNRNNKAGDLKMIMP